MPRGAGDTGGHGPGQDGWDGYAIARLRLDGDVPGLYRAAREADRPTAYGSVALLADIGSPAAADALLDLLRGRDTGRLGTRLRAASALGRLREARAVPALLRLLDEVAGESDRRRKTVVRALGRIGGPGAAAVLLRRWEEGEDPPWVLVHALTRLRAPEAVPALLTEWDRVPASDPFGRIRVVRALGTQRDPRAGAVLLSVAGDPATVPPVRAEAIDALARLPHDSWPDPQDPRTGELLRPGVADPSPRTGPLAAGLLARTPAGRTELRRILDGALRRTPGDHRPSVTVVVRALTVLREHPGLLGAAGGGLVVRLLREAPQPIVRRAAAPVVAAGGPEAAEVLLTALDDERITDAVAAALAGLPVPPEERLLALLAHGTGPARRGAAAALGLAGCARAAPALLAAVDATEPTDLRTAAADALGALRHRPAAGRLAALAADREEAGTVRARALCALGLIGVPESLPVVLACLREPREAVRVRAASALGGFPVPQAAQALGPVVAGDADPDVARAAVRALGHIGAPASSVLCGLAHRLRPDIAPDLVAALARCPGADATGALALLALSPPVPGRVRADAVRALGERATPECVAPLAELVADGRRYACHPDALRGLARAGGTEARGHVLAYCRHSADHVETAREALGLLGPV
ncbi:HEAT repeat domain-containing protein [Streptomyces yaizuensis]|uniref:HEAT repeat domain-containing protein n=1 Tax=Streptomyces yaizuensis TaxID=2989713 RepID=A0ABQ5NSG5_9ACTN|nr:HEAT repeat domain-containing protein [Streptomyces sp. YSPA8]GLF93099.1 HEAT repeat domain-containing protein [Streptomyces sp. YSPA8]